MESLVRLMVIMLVAFATRTSAQRNFEPFDFDAGRSQNPEVRPRQTTPIPILQQINEHNEDGSYSYGYEAADGSFKLETRYPDGRVKGKYGYIDITTGELKVIEYGAGDLGFQPQGDLPEGIVVPPPVIGNDTTFDTTFDNGRADNGEEFLGSGEPQQTRFVVENRARGSSRQQPSLNQFVQPSQNRGQDIQSPVTPSPRPRLTEVIKDDTRSFLPIRQQQPAFEPQQPQQPQLDAFSAFQTPFDFPRGQILDIERNRPIETAAPSRPFAQTQQSLDNFNRPDGKRSRQQFAVQANPQEILGNRAEIPTRSSFENVDNRAQIPTRPRFENEENRAQIPTRPRFENEENRAQIPTRPSFENVDNRAEIPTRPRFESSSPFSSFQANPNLGFEGNNRRPESSRARNATQNAGFNAPINPAAAQLNVEINNIRPDTRSRNQAFPAFQAIISPSSDELRLNQFQAESSTRTRDELDQRPNFPAFQPVPQNAIPIQNFNQEQPVRPTKQESLFQLQQQEEVEAETTTLQPVLPALVEDQRRNPVLRHQFREDSSEDQAVITTEKPQDDTTTARQTFLRNFNRARARRPSFSPASTPAPVISKATTAEPIPDNTTPAQEETENPPESIIASRFRPRPRVVPRPDLSFPSEKEEEPEEQKPFRLSRPGSSRLQPNSFETTIAPSFEPTPRSRPKKFRFEQPSSQQESEADEDPQDQSSPPRFASFPVKDRRPSILQSRPQSEADNEGEQEERPFAPRPVRIRGGRPKFQQQPQEPKSEAAILDSLIHESTGEGNNPLSQLPTFENFERSSIFNAIPLEQKFQSQPAVPTE